MNRATFVCDNCKGRFPFTEDEAAHKESVAQWGRRGDDPGMAIVCHDCWQQIMDWYNRLPAAAKAAAQ